MKESDGASQSGHQPRLGHEPLINATKTPAFVPLDDANLVDLNDHEA